MSIQHNIVSRLFESKHLPDGLTMEDVRLSETVVVGGNWYWKSRGTCWTQPTDKSKPRQEIPYEEYRKMCAQSKNGVTELPTNKEEPSKSEDLPSAREDYYGDSNPYRVGRSGDFEKDMKFIQGRESGVTAKITYGDKTEEYARKVGPNSWKTDSGKTLSDNDVASVAYDGGKTTINYMIKNKPSTGTSPDKSEKETPSFTMYDGTKMLNGEDGEPINYHRMSTEQRREECKLNGLELDPRLNDKEVDDIALSVRCGDMKRAKKLNDFYTRVYDSAQR